MSTTELLDTARPEGAPRRHRASRAVGAEESLFACGIDVGGTFTDIVLHVTEGDRCLATKVLTTQYDPSEAIRTGLTRLLDEAGLLGQDRNGRAIHATTLVTNALIERRGAKTALVTTKGFRDILDFRRENRYDIFNLALAYPDALVPLELRWEINERVSAEGETIVPLELADIERVAREMRASEIEAVAVVLLHAYAFPTHESRVVGELRRLLPGIPISGSHSVSPHIREYERTTTTVVNAYAAPRVDAYLSRLSSVARGCAPGARLSLMVSNGGTCSVETARQFPVRLLESGPAAGVLAVRHFGEILDEESLLAFDMGGTTAKLSVLQGSRPMMTTQFEAAHAARFQKGSGIPVSVPSIDLIEIGAGGGSIAFVDNLGLLQVGPRSAGSAPGPACYDFGGLEPTLTDADLLLGYLDAQQFLGGSMVLNRDAAAAAMQSGVADPLGVDLERASWGVHDLVNENMAIAARLHLAAAGLDPRAFSLMVTGGAGPLHGVHLADKLGIRHVICPPSPGVASAFGLVVSPARVDLSTTFISLLDEVDWDVLEDTLADLAHRAREMAEQAGVTTWTVERFADMSYAGQTHHIEVPLPVHAQRESKAASVRQSFDQHYVALYGATVPGSAHKIAAVRVTVNGPAHVAPPPAELHASRVAIASAKRPAYFSGAFHEGTAVRSRDSLRAGERRGGPAIVVSSDSSLVVDHGWDYWADELGAVHAMDVRP